MCGSQLKLNSFTIAAVVLITTLMGMPQLSLAQSELTVTLRQKHNVETITKFGHNIERLVKVAEALGLVIADEDREVFFKADTKAILEARSWRAKRASRRSSGQQNVAGGNIGECRQLGDRCGGFEDEIGRRILLSDLAIDGQGEIETVKIGEIGLFECDEVRS